MNIVDHSYNLWNEKWELGAYSTVDGTKVESSVSLRNKEPISIRPNQTYYIKCNPVGARLYFYDINKNYLSTALANNSTFTSPNNAYFLSFNSGNASTPITTYNHDICINVSKTDINGNYYPFYFKRYDMVDLILPNEYQEVEYVESTGTQYIDLGLKANQNSKVIIKAKKTNINSSYLRLLGSRNTVASSGFFISINFQKFYADYDGQNTTTTYVVDTNYHIFELSKNGFLIDNQSYANFVYLSFETPSNLLLFAGFSQNTVGYGDYRVYSCKMYNNNILVRNFIPCYRKADNVIGLYDTVNNQFYTNQGTGTFLKGANVNNYKRLKIGG